MNYYVSATGSDAHPGSLAQPFRTLQKAADTMQAGDIAYIRSGIYREWVKPPRGGDSEERRITYAAYPGEYPEIKGSERITDWRRESGTVWMAVRPNAFFGGYNPYALGITGEWLEWTRGLHRGDVYVNGDPLRETADDAELAATVGMWAATVDADRTTIRANFGVKDPNRELTEIQVRELVFFPERAGVSYITVRGLTLMHAANNWAPPESFQRGLIGVNWGRGWIIEHCRISDAKCVGISSGHFDPASPPPALDIESVGHHIVRHNHIRRCGEAGIAGNLGFCASRIEYNWIEEINHKVEFGGEETAGIKVHTAVDVEVRGNLIRRVRDGRGHGGGDYPGIWIDWCNQGARVTGNVVYETDHYGLFLEACHGPLLVDNNIFIGRVLRLHAKRVVMAHNLFIDSGFYYQDWTADQRTPAWFAPHSWRAAGSGRMRVEGNRFFNNIFVRSHLPAPPQPVDGQSDDNLYCRCRIEAPPEARSVVADEDGPTVTIRDAPEGVELEIRLTEAVSAVPARPVKPGRIGIFAEVQQGLEDHTGRPVGIDADIGGAPRDPARPTVGPVERTGSPVVRIRLKVGPMKEDPYHAGGAT